MNQLVTSVMRPLVGPTEAPPAHPPVWTGMHAGANIQRTIRIGTFAIIAIFGGFGLWATLAPITGAVIGTGVVIVDAKRKTVQHLEGGIIKEVLVRDGDYVRAGDPLLVIVDERVDASVDVLQGQLAAEFIKQARLEAERDGLEEIEFPQLILDRSGDPKIADLMRTEREFFTTRTTGLRDQINLMTTQIEQSREEIESLHGRAAAEEKASALLQQQIDAYETLEIQNYVGKTQILDLKRGIEEYKARRGEHLADMARAKQKITDLELRIVNLRERRQEEVSEQLSISQVRIYDLQERLRPSQDAQRRQTIAAPISGTVVNSKIFAVGSVIAPREALMDIVPEGDTLVVEAQISVDAIDDVHIGQDADVRLSAYARRTTPLVYGTVSYVSADRMTSPDERSFWYVVRIDITRQALLEAGDLKMYPGMPAEIFIKTGERTVLDYMLTPFANTMHRALREP